LSTIQSSSSIQFSISKQIVLNIQISLKDGYKSTRKAATVKQAIKVTPPAAAAGGAASSPAKSSPAATVSIVCISKLK